MRVLYITDFYYTDSSGAKTSARAHYKTLQNLYGSENVNLIALVGKSKSSRVNEGHFVISNIHNRITMLWNCLRGYPTYIDKVSIQKILSIIYENEPDVLFVDNSIYGKMIQKIKMLYPNISVLAYYHDVKAKLARDWMKNAPIYKKPVMLAMLSNEKLTAKYADVNFVAIGKKNYSLMHMGKSQKRSLVCIWISNCRMSSLKKILIKRRKFCSLAVIIFQMFMVLIGL